MSSYLIAALGVGFALYLVPINLVLVIYVILMEVRQMIDRAIEEETEVKDEKSEDAEISL